MALPPGLARFNRRVTNRVTGPLAGWLPGFAVVIHRGRRSGRMYRTPVNAFRDGNDYIIALTYGAETDWARNVRAAGGCQLMTRGDTVSLTNPRVVTDISWRWAPVPVRLVLKLVGATEYMRLTTVPAPVANRLTENLR